MFQESKLAKYLIASIILHIIIALAMAQIYAEQPQRQRPLVIKSAVRIQYEEPEPPPPEPKPKPEVQPKKVAPKTKPPEPKEEPKIEPKEEIVPPKAPRRRRQMSASAPSLGVDNVQMPTVSESGVTGIKGARGPSEELPTSTSASGIEHPTRVTETGGTGLSPGLMNGSMKMPEGTGSVPGIGGKEVAGFRMGTSGTGTDGVGKVDVAGSGGRGGKADDGPGTGLSTFAGRVNTGGGKGTTGRNHPYARGGNFESAGQRDSTGPVVGSGDGMGEIDAAPVGSESGPGRGGPGSGGYQLESSRTAPSVTTVSGVTTGDAQEAPGTKDLPEAKREGAIGKKEFKADAKTNMTGVKQTIEETEERTFGDALQAEINKNLHSLRKMYEDWENSKVPNIPKALQITIELGSENGKPKLIKLNLHQAKVSARIRDDLTTKIKTWKFESLFDGKNDPDKWPIKLSGKISWQ